jgi:outer membrane protein OmpA-like peptidoglycan-associated protein
MHIFGIARIVTAIVALCMACVAEASCSLPEPDTATISFSFADVGIDAESLAALDRVREKMLKRMAEQSLFLTIIIVVGYSDETGPADYNNLLSRRRADAVKEYWMRNGIEEKRVYAEPGRVPEPIQENQKAADRITSESTGARRVEVEIHYGSSKGCDDTHQRLR